MGIKNCCWYTSTADAESLHVKFADEAVCIGPPQVIYLT
jgi:acetyl-CoA carboxylase biotin carboxylase subunit